MWISKIELTKGGLRYRAIAEAIRDAAQIGELRPGDSLPTHRALAERLGVTVGTVSRAYSVAADWGADHLTRWFRHGNTRPRRTGSNHPLGHRTAGQSHRIRPSLPRRIDRCRIAGQVLGATVRGLGSRSPEKVFLRLFAGTGPHVPPGDRCGLAQTRRN